MRFGASLLGCFSLRHMIVSFVRSSRENSSISRRQTQRRFGRTRLGGRPRRQSPQHVEVVRSRRGGAVRWLLAGPVQRAAARGSGMMLRSAALCRALLARRGRAAG